VVQGFGADQMKRRRTKYQGVYERKSEGKLFKGKPDICYDITYKHEGRKVWEKSGWLSEGYSAKLAADIRAERLRPLRHGEELPHEKKKAPFFKEAAERFLDWAKDNRTRAGQDEKIRYEKYFRQFDDKRMEQISSFDIERLKSDLSKQGLADATIKYVLVLIRQIYNKAILWGFYQGTKPFSGVKMPMP